MYLLCVCLVGNAQKQLRKLVQAMNKAKTTVRNIFRISMRSLDFPMHMKNFLKSGEMDSWSHAIRAYSVSVSIKERQDVAKAALTVIIFIADHGNMLNRGQLIKVPDLFASVANLCNNELLQHEDSQEILEDIFLIVKCFTRDFVHEATALTKANWAELLVRSFKYTEDRKNIISSIYWFVVHTNEACKMTLITAGVEKLLKEVIETTATEDKDLRYHCRKLLEQLMLKEDE